MLLTAESPLSKLQNGIFRKPICHAFLTTDDADAIGDTPDDQILLNTDYADLHGCATRMPLMTRLSDYFQEKPQKPFHRFASYRSLCAAGAARRKQASTLTPTATQGIACLAKSMQEKPKKHKCLQACIPHGVFQRSGVFLPERVSIHRIAGMSV